MKTLVIIDSTKQTRKIVPEHSQEIGRGKFLECEDKRVSRTHGRIAKESKGSKLLLRLESLHINSIFCRKKDGTSDYQLKKDEAMLLEVGDKFRLLQDGDWYEVGEDTPDVDSQSTAMSVEMENQSATLQDNTPSKRKYDEDNTEDTTKRQRVLGEESYEEPSTSSQRLSVNHSVDHDKTVPQETNASVDAEFAPAVKVKSDPEKLSVNSNVPEVQIKPDPDAGGCNTESGNVNDPGPSGSPKVNNVPLMSVKPDPDGMGGQIGLAVLVPSVAVLRPSCDFGIRCYRAGQDHRNAYAHPGDLDYRRPNLPPPPPGTPMCPFGARCYRRNPQHFREYDHPDPNAVLPRTPRHYGASRRQADDNMSDEEYHDDSEPDFDDTSSDEYLPGMGDESDDNDSGLDC